MKRIVQLFFVIIGATIGFAFIPQLIRILNFGDTPPWVTDSYTGAIIGALLFYVLTIWMADSVVNWIKMLEERLVKAPVGDVMFGTFGLVFGLIVAILIPLPPMDYPALKWAISFLLACLFAYFGFRVGFKKRDELIGVFTVSAKTKEKKKDPDDPLSPASVKMKILDTSVIIDGRIADICQTGFLEGTLVIPRFVLEELQHIADSSDVLKRNRGRRGLDILNRIQKELDVKVEIYEGDFEEISEVDSKLVKLAKLVSGIVVTNDFNLNKVCELQGVAVLNINDLANAVKPVVLPGEELKVQVIKDGKEHNQGVGYLDDGTMIVVEEGRDYIGKTIEVLVTSVLQTSAGRMIFAKPKLMERAL
ncbi:MAG TPA: PIN/TRAM domain-containing protein [Bacillales bacterium]|nr:PIN/TRAM domain-containing protein [Bacillales bacterium]